MKMKNSVLLFAIICLFCSSAFAQSDRVFKYEFESPLKDSLFSNLPKHFNLEGIDGYKNYLIDSLDKQHVLPKKYSFRKNNIGQELLGSIEKPGFSMPVIKPKGNFPMQVYRPDTTVIYYLLIKK
jgi:hypothetical protein